jgi:demethylmenaquinone methyltransferase / 2-methoxy-6-polyprenyl-1,4-benzoquinol methylase
MWGDLWRFESSREHFILSNSVFSFAMAPETVPTPASRDQDPSFVQKAFASIAPRYVLTNHILSLGIDVAWRRQVAKIVATKNPALVLDVATGSGDLAAEVWKACPESRIVGIANASADVITIGYGLRNMESWAGAVREFARVLKPAGTLVILDFSLPTHPLLRIPYRFYLHHILPVVAGWLTGNREAYQYLGASIERFPRGQSMLDLLLANGFSSAKSISLGGGISSVYVAEITEIFR